MATILIVDDRPTNRDLLTTLLSYQDHRLLEAELAAEGLAIAIAEHPDLVITDIIMPEIDGFEFVRRIRAIPEIANTRVIFYSANYIESEARGLAQACGVEYVIAKPADPELILATVQSALGLAAAPARPLPADEFDRAHQRLLIDKLAEKVDELEMLNAQLEQRVYERTAELAEANAHLRELNTFKDNLLAIASHDLRSPLGIIQGIASMIQEDERTPEYLGRSLQTIIRSARQLTDLVNDILDLSRLEAGKADFDFVPLRASFVAKQVVESLQFSAQAKQISIGVNVEPGELSVMADWRKISQAFSNLLVNAVKFTMPGGSISVTVMPQDTHMCLRVADTGIGIPVESMPHLFEKFHRAHASGTADERGSGLGLAIVHQIVDLHGGTITVQSEVGYGSAFTISLPVAVAEPIIR